MCIGWESRVSAVIGRGEIYGQKRRWVRRERISQCQPWHRHSSKGADGAMRWHFALHFLPQLLLPAGKGRRRAGRRERVREMDKTEWEWSRDDEKRKKWWKIVNPHLCHCPLLLSPALQLHSLSVSSLLASLNLCPHFSPGLSAEADTGRALPAGSSKVCGGGLAASNEVPSVRFQTSTASLAFSNGSTKWWTGRGLE